MAENYNQLSANDTVFGAQSSAFKCLLTLSGHLNTVRFVALSPDGQTLVSGSSDRIRVWNLNSGQEICTLIKVSGRLSIGRIALSLDGQTLVCESGTGIIKVWNLHTRQQVRTFRGHSAQILALALSRDGQTLVSGSGDGTIKIWNLKKEREIGLLIETELNGDSMALSPDG